MAVKTGLPLHYLDMIWHKPDRTTVSREEFDERLREIMAGPEWILDGNYKRTMAMRLKEADTVFLFDLPMEVCLEGAKKRLGGYRPDMPWHDTELSEEFEEWIVNFPDDQLPIIYDHLRNFPGEIHIFHSHAEADAYLNASSSSAFSRRYS